MEARGRAGWVEVGSFTVSVGRVGVDYRSRRQRTEEIHELELSV